MKISNVGSIPVPLAASSCQRAAYIPTISSSSLCSAATTEKPSCFQALWNWILSVYSKVCSCCKSKPPLAQPATPQPEPHIAPILNPGLLQNVAPIQNPDLPQPQAAAENPDPIQPAAVAEPIQNPDPIPLPLEAVNAVNRCRENLASIFPTADNQFLRQPTKALFCIKINGKICDAVMNIITIDSLNGFHEATLQKMEEVLQRQIPLALQNGELFDGYKIEIQILLSLNPQVRRPDYIGNITGISTRFSEARRIFTRGALSVAYPRNWRDSIDDLVRHHRRLGDEVAAENRRFQDQFIEYLDNQNF